jgi:predicted RNA-binding protein with TRAM domain
MYGERSRGFDRPRSFAPVKVGEEMDVTIEAVGEKGDGICKKKGFVLFVPNTKQGDNVKIRVTKVLRKVGFAEVIGEGSPQPAEEQPKAEEAAPQEEEIPQGEESENFGEESQEEQQ